MIGVLLLCWAFAAGLRWWRVVLLGAVLTLPLAVAPIIAVVAWRSKGGDDDRPALFCEGVASELRSGASLRQALSQAADSVGCMSPPPGSALPEVAAEISDGFPSIRQELRLTILTAARSGSAAAAVFDELGSLAIAQAEIRREVRVARAPGRATALVFIGAPLLFVTSRVSSGQAGALLTSPHQRMVTILGLGLLLAGLATASLVAWRA